MKCSGYARHDSKGYRNAKKKLVNEIGYLTKAGKLFKLTEKGRTHLIDSGKLYIPPEPTTNEEAQAQLKEALLKIVKAPTKKLEAVWDTLMDGKAHSVDDLVKEAGYERSDSKGYRQIIKGMNTLEMLDKPSKGKLQFSAKVYQFGRP